MVSALFNTELNDPKHNYIDAHLSLALSEIYYAISVNAISST